MPRKTAPLLPATSELLRQFGERLRLARLRRRLSAKQVAERAGMNPMTLRSLERGGSGVTIGAYLAVMQVLGIEKELDHIVQADPIGRSLQDARLITPDFTLRTGDQPGDVRADRERQATPSVQPRESAQWSGGFVSSRELANLLAEPTARSAGPSRTKSKPMPKPKARTKTQTKTKTVAPSSRARRR